MSKCPVCGSLVDLVERELRAYDRATIAKVIATVRFVVSRGRRLV